jgi:hypothetical protein
MRAARNCTPQKNQEQCHHKQGTGWLSRAAGTLCKESRRPAAAAHQPQQQHRVRSQCAQHNTRPARRKPSRQPKPRLSHRKTTPFVQCTKTAIPTGQQPRCCLAVRHACKAKVCVSHKQRQTGGGWRAGAGAGGSTWCASREGFRRRACGTNQQKTMQASAPSANITPSPAF